jgi:predicted ATP-grasp superfamily ATP-dependent carboligase
MAYVLAIPGAGAAGYVAYQHMVETNWLDPPPRDAER